jgi:hypothetical protein
MSDFLPIIPLEGKELLAKVATLAQVSRWKTAIECGYYTVMPTDEGLPTKLADLQRFYEALMRAEAEAQQDSSIEMPRPDWQAILQIVYQRTVMVIEDFGMAHPEEEVCYLAYDVNAHEGEIRIGLDTTENSKIWAQKEAARLVHQIHDYSQSNGSWQFINGVMSQLSFLPFSNQVTNFKYPNYSEIKFRGWQTFIESDDYPNYHFPKAEDYLEGKMVFVFWHVVQQLIKQKKLRTLAIASPFYVGYRFHNQAQVVLRMINC